MPKTLIRTKRVTIYRHPNTGRFISKTYAEALKIHGRYYQQTRDFHGRIVLQPKWKPTPKMWRMTIAINYAIHHDYFCIKIQIWHRNRKILQRQALEIETELWNKLREILEKYSLQEMIDHGALMQDITGYKLDTEGMRLGIEYAKVPYDSKLINKREFSHEYLRSKRRRRRRK